MRDVLMDDAPHAAAVSATLALCDRALGEVGRRSHRFAWLRAPGGGPREWIPVDAYYPVNRLVVVCGERSVEDDAVFAELVPAHGLRLLELDPAELGAVGTGGAFEDPAAAEQALARRVSVLELPERVVPESDRDPVDVERDNPISRVAASFAQATAPAMFEPPPSPGREAATERAARVMAARRAELAASAAPPTRAPRMVASIVPAASRRGAMQPRGPAPETRARLIASAYHRAHSRSDTAPEVAAVGLLVGLVLAAVLAFELYVGVGRLALSGGHVVLAFGLALDGAARALGTVAAERAGDTGWAWACVLGGSPAVAGFAVFGRDGPVVTEPAPLAGIISVLAMLLIGAAIVGNLLG
jgi:hypothetical protein